MITRLLDRLRRGEGGFALVEVLASTLILAIGIYPAIDIVTRGHETSATAQNLEIMSRAGTEAIEELRALPWATLKTGAVSSSTAIPSGVPVPGRLDLATAKYQVPSGGPLEPLAWSSTGTLKRYQRMTIGSGTGARTVDVWRIPSFRTESCPVLDLSGMLSAVTTLRTTLAQSVAMLAGLTAAGSGDLAKITARGNSAIAALSNPLFSSTVAALTPAVSAAATLRTTLLTIQTSLSTLDANLLTLQTTINSGTANGLLAGQVLDLCQLPDDTVLPSVGDIGALSSALGTLNSGGTTGGFENLRHVADDLEDDVERADDLAHAGLLGTVLNALLTPVRAAINSRTPQLSLTGSVLATSSDGKPVVAANATASQTSLPALASGEVTKITSLLSALAVGNPSNTVRLTVAVRLVDPPPGTGPRTTVYFTSVVTNPRAGLL